MLVSPDLLPRVRAELRSGRCNLLHIHAPNPWGDFAALGAAADIPVVLTWHSDVVRQRRLLKLYGGIQRRVLERADRIVVFTPKHYESSSQLHQIDVESKIVSIPIGIYFTRLDPTVASTSTFEAIERFVHGRPFVLSVGTTCLLQGLSAPALRP